MESLSIELIKKLIQEKNLKWTRHVIIRLFQRQISQEDVEYCLQNGEIIEMYNTSYPYPSCLVYGTTKGDKIIHTVVGFDDKDLWIITAYYPNNNEWENDFKARRKLN